MKAFIAMPSYQWAASIPTVRSLLNDLLALQKRGDEFIFYDEAGNTEIGAAREAIFCAFLKSDADCLVFIDDDVCWQSGALLDLIDTPHDLIGGVYRKRIDEEIYPVKWLDRAELQAVDGALEVASIPTGFMKISRKCAERMSEKFGNAVFDNIRKNGSRMSEDISFCTRWRMMGGTVWCLPEINMGHVGRKIFSGSLGNWLRNRK